MSRLEEITRTGGQHPLLVEAMVNADGQAFSYRVISGQLDARMQRELDQVLFFSRFRPQMRRYYYDPSKYRTDLEQRGIT